MPETPRRSLRADDTTWDRAKELAYVRRTSVSELIRSLIDRLWKEEPPKKKRGRNGG